MEHPRVRFQSNLDESLFSDQSNLNTLTLLIILIKINRKLSEKQIRSTFLDKDNAAARDELGLRGHPEQDQE